MASTAATRAVDDLGLPHGVIEHAPVKSLQDAAVARGVEPADVIKTLVVRRAETDYLLVVVAGDRTISWPVRPTVVGVSGISMMETAQAKEIPGYTRGTIPPFGALT